MAKFEYFFLKDDLIYREAWILSVVVALIMTILSCLGLSFSDVFYPTASLREQYLANDAVSLLIGTPIFLVSLRNKDQLYGALLLPSALIYVIYNYVAYALGRPWDWTAACGLVLVILSSIALIFLLKAMDHDAVMQRLAGKVGERSCGWVLVMFGLGFIALAVSTISSTVAEEEETFRGEKSVAISDIIVSLGWVGGGILLLYNKPLGYSTGLGLLVAASCLFLGLVLYFFIAPLVSDRLLDWMEVISVLVMGFVCFIPTGLFWRGVMRRSAPESELKSL